jgi:hypothetical protein
MSRRPTGTAPALPGRRAAFDAVDVLEIVDHVDRASPVRPRRSYRPA